MTKSPDAPRFYCTIEAPEDFIPKARYAIRMLLDAFRVDIEWVQGHDSRICDLYYGMHPEHAPDGAQVFGLDQGTVDFFEGIDPVPPSADLVNIGGDDVPALFNCSAGGAFDLIASTFFFLSGWQEYFSTARDEHGRVRYEDSIQSRLNSRDIPFVDAYRVLLRHLLRRRAVVIDYKQWGGKSWAFCPTHDIDYVRKWRPGIVRREILQRSILNREKEPVSVRSRRFSSALHGLLSGDDPFQDAIRRIRTEVERRSGTATFFFKAAARGAHDVRYAADSVFLQTQYASLRKSGFEIGLHPSYHGFNHPGYLAEERNILTGASGIQASSIRSHYLRFDPVRTGRIFSESGFKLDSTLGWSSHEGFRHATCCPFQLFDLSVNTPLDIWEMPLMMMESALFNRQGLSLDEAVDRTRAMLATCRKYGGVFVGLWHNTLWDESDFPSWGDHFVTTLDDAQASDSLISSLSDAFNAWR